MFSIRAHCGCSWPHGCERHSSFEVGVRNSCVHDSLCLVCESLSWLLKDLSGGPVVDVIK